MNISNEFVFSRYKKGIVLLPPETMTETAHLSVENILKQPFSIYFVKGNDCSLGKINSTCAQNCGFDSEFSAIGKIASDFLNKESAHFAVAVDKTVMVQETVNICEHMLEHNEGTSYQYLTIKSPWYQQQNVVGVFGCSIMLGLHPLAESLQCIAELGLLSANVFKTVVAKDRASLSKQELSLAKLLITGLTAKEMAKRVNLSHRTVETYLINIKAKLQCKNKTELVIKLADLLGYSRY
ncbi:LuxR family transcriptional regulator [Legionella pneumophila]|uniref:helix-turn-helix transcriptional regulator n=1 Tax=Legionella pneumophila TaxID=446 RepID=UPI00101E6A20|nr:helix-turn-helix transcriptional regulator [Legionella pneumophila]RYW88249.1 LuxR family transcriptional regulator [Legionella pneumophila]